MTTGMPAKPSAEAPAKATAQAQRTRNPRGQGERLRGALIDAAIEVLGEVQDVEALSVRAVTARAGVSPTALYLHFADREELLAAVKDRCFAALRGYLLAGEAEGGPDPREQAEAMCLAYLDFAAALPAYYRVLFHTRRPGDTAASTPPLDDGATFSSMTAGWPTEGAGAFGDLVRAVGRCLPHGRDTFETGTMVWAGLHGLVALRSMPPFPLPANERYVSTLLDAHLGPS